MSVRRWLPIVIGATLLIVLVFVVTAGLERLFSRPVEEAAAPAARPPSGDVPHITATLFYATADAQSLIGVRREVPLAANSIEQGRAILTAQMGRAPEGLIATIPEGTSVRAFYVTPGGDAFVDLSLEVVKGHPGGSSAELLTVYTIVNAVTANLPAIQRVQILIDGKEADTLAGHVDLRRPLPRDRTLVRETADALQ